MSVYDLANRLAKQIKKSEEYKNYQEMREKIISNDKSMEMLQDYQQEQLKVQSRQLSGEDLSEEDRQKLENLREIIELNPEVKKYLDAEYRVSVMLNDLQRILFSDLEIGIFSGEEEQDE